MQLREKKITENDEAIRGPVKTGSIQVLKNRLADVRDNSGNRLERRLKSTVVHKAHVSFATK